MFKFARITIIFCAIFAFSAYGAPNSGCVACERWVDGAECTTDGPKFWFNCEAQRFCWCFPENICYCEWDCAGTRCYQV